MNQPVLQAAPALPDASAIDRAALRFDRARTELRHGRALVVIPAQPGAPSLLVAAIESLDEERLRWFEAAAGTAPRLLLTERRLQALGWPAASTARSHALSAPVALQALKELSALGEAEGDVGKLVDPRPASAAMEAALMLAKRARLTPALCIAELAPERGVALEAAQVLAIAQAEIALTLQAAPARLQQVSEARVPLAACEDARVVVFKESDGDAEHVALIVGRPDVARPVTVRLHSACLTGDLLGSLRCDCGDQLERAVSRLAQDGGVLLYLAQEGRGTGLANKLRAYRLQDGGLDTIDADRHRGFSGDERDFGVAVAMLEALGIGRIRLLTNNPRKIEALRGGGIDVVDRLPLIAPANPHNRRYLQTKRQRGGHLPPVEDEQE